MDRFIRTNFDEFVTTPAFYELPLSDFSNYLKHRNLKTETEETVLSAVVRWCRHNKLWNDFSGVYFQACNYLSTNYFAIIFRGIYSDKETKFEKKNHPLSFDVTKGQIISECPYEIIVWTKIATKKFPRFLS